MVEFEKKDNGKCLIIRPPMPPDEDEMIKETFFFFETPEWMVRPVLDGFL